MFCILGKYRVTLSHGGVHASLGTYGYVTHVLIDGYIEAWVRENVRRGRGASFLTSSTARIGEKHRGVSGVQVLELAVKPEHLDRAREVIQQTLDEDADDRPLVQHRSWTVATAPAFVKYHAW